MTGNAIGARGGSQDTANQVFSRTVRLLRSRVSRYALQGVLIAFGAIIVASALVAALQLDDMSLGAMLDVHRRNVALWALDLMPFVFALWGQYSSSLMAYEAGAMVMDQTNDLRVQAAALEIQVQHGVTYDLLTDLPNRMLFHDRVEQAISAAKRNGTRLAVLVLDLDGFKEINNTLGHLNGDMMLRQVASRLEGEVREPDTVARLGSDEFAVLLGQVRSIDDAHLVASKLVSALGQSFVIAGVEMDVLASLGVVIYPEHGEDADTLLQRADVAMYTAKQASGFSVVDYAPEQDQHSPYRLSLMGELRRAIENRELVVYYQPKVNIETRRINAVEALVRWPHPQHGMLPPDEFIGLAERSGLIRPLTHYVVGEAIRQAAEWQRYGLDIGMAVNVSARVLLDPELPDLIRDQLADSGLDPTRLVVEITESSIMEDQVRALENVTRLSEQGIRISIDDFGTGYSSLAYLRRLPVDEIKIDKSFVMTMVANENDAVIVRATIGLAHNLGLDVIAEGVEDDDIWERLHQLGCDYAQGYYISKPISGVELTRMLMDSPWGEGRGVVENHV